MNLNDVMVVVLKDILLCLLGLKGSYTYFTLVDMIYKTF